jgi:hypothetical protein
MFIRKNKNRKGTVSVQIISKASGKYQVLKTIGCGNDDPSIELLYQRARQEFALLQKQRDLFVSADDALIESFLSGLSNAQMRTIIGFSSIKYRRFISITHNSPKLCVNLTLLLLLIELSLYLNSAESYDGYPALFYPGEQAVPALFI